MELEFSCPQCGSPNRVYTAEEKTVLSCSYCDYVGLLPLDWSRDRQVMVCPICGGGHLFRQREWHQKATFLLLLGGAALALLTRFVSLVLAAAAAVMLFFRAPEQLVCYRCRARIRGHAPSDRQRRYDPRLDLRRPRPESPRDRSRNSHHNLQ